MEIKPTAGRPVQIDLLQTESTAPPLPDIPNPKEVAKPADSDTGSESAASKQPINDKRTAQDALIRFFSMPNDQLPLFMELLEKLMSWTPDPAHLPLEDLEQLQKLYQALIQIIMTHTQGTEQEEQLSQVNRLLSLALQKFIHCHVNATDAFFEAFDSEASWPALRNSIYKSVTGQTLSSKEATLFWNQKTVPQTPLSNTPKSSDQGVLYHPAGSRQIRTNPAYLNQMTADKRMSAHTLTAGSLKASPAQLPSDRSASVHKPAAIQFHSSSHAPAGKLYTMSDLEISEPFIRHLTIQGNLLDQPPLTTAGDDLLGIFSGMTAIKTDLFCNTAKLSCPMKNSIRSAADKMIDYYVGTRLLEHAANTEKLPQKQSSPSEAASIEKQIYKLYYHVLNRYQTHKNPEKALFDGLSYTRKEPSEVPTEKLAAQNVQHTNFKKTDQASESFLFALPDEWKKGLLFLNMNWKEFLKVIHQEQTKAFFITFDPRKSRQTEAMEKSPWGLDVKPNALPGFLFSKNTIYLILFGFLLLLIVAFLLLKL